MGGINFMGCFGGLNGLKVAKAFVASEPGAICLLVCVEICSAHFTMNEERGKFIGNSIFADGGSAAIVGPGGPGDGHSCCDDLVPQRSCLRDVSRQKHWKLPRVVHFQKPWVHAVRGLQNS